MASIDLWLSDVQAVSEDWSASFSAATHGVRECVGIGRHGCRCSRCLVILVSWPRQVFYGVGGGQLAGGGGGWRRRCGGRGVCVFRVPGLVVWAQQFFGLGQARLVLSCCCKFGLLGLLFDCNV